MGSLPPQALAELAAAIPLGRVTDLPTLLGQLANQASQLLKFCACAALSLQREGGPLLALCNGQLTQLEPVTGDDFQALCRSAQQHLCKDLAYFPLACHGRILGLLAVSAGGNGLSQAQRQQLTALAEKAVPYLAHLLGSSDQGRSWHAAPVPSAAPADPQADLFRASLCHDMASSLDGIGLYCNLLSSGTLGELAQPQRQAIDSMLAAQRHARALIRELRHGRQSTPGAPGADLLPVALVLGEALAIVQPNLIAQQHILTRQFGSGLGLCNDAHALRQVLVNLLGNAIKYTPPGGCVSVSAWAAEPADGPPQTFMEIRDSGAGIAAEDLPRIFEPYFRGQWLEPSQRPSGHGLGLMIVRELVTHLGGSIEVHSQARQGSTFRLSIPVQAEPVQAGGPAALCCI